MNVTPSIPIELMDILNSINTNISEVKERISKIEAQDHSDGLRSLRAELKEEREKRIELQVEVKTIQTRMAPFAVAAYLIGAAIMQYVLASVVN